MRVSHICFAEIKISATAKLGKLKLPLAVFAIPPLAHAMSAFYLKTTVFSIKSNAGKKSATLCVGQGSFPGLPTHLRKNGSRVGIVWPPEFMAACTPFKRMFTVY